MSNKPTRTATGSAQATSHPSQPQAGLSPEPFLSRRELAERWGCCIHTIARRHDLETVRLSRRLLRYRLKDVEAIETAAGK